MFFFFLRIIIIVGLKWKEEDLSWVGKKEREKGSIQFLDVLFCSASERELMAFHFFSFLFFNVPVLWHDSSLIVFYYYFSKKKNLGVFYSCCIFTSFFFFFSVVLSLYQRYTDTVITQRLTGFTAIFSLECCGFDPLQKSHSCYWLSTLDFFFFFSNVNKLIRVHKFSVLFVGLRLQ